MHGKRIGGKGTLTKEKEDEDKKRRVANVLERNAILDEDHTWYQAQLRWQKEDMGELYLPPNQGGVPGEGALTERERSFMGVM